MTSGYSILPPVYDRWQQTYGRDYSALILPRLLQTIKQFRIPVSTIVDIACGTGSLAEMMSDRGWSVWGIDVSEGMIRVAASRSGHAARSVRFSCQDMRHIRLPGPVMLATSMFDSVNHMLTLRDLHAAFKAVHNALLPGGYFIFDTNNELCFNTLWTRTESITHDDFDLVLNCSFDAGKALGVVRVVLFEKDGRSYVRKEEQVRERCYSRDEISRSLVKAGFQIRRAEDFNFSPVKDAGLIKTWWVVQR